MSFQQDSGSRSDCVSHLGGPTDGDDREGTGNWPGRRDRVAGSPKAGKVLVRDGEVLTADEAAIRAEAQLQAEAVARRVDADPVHREMALLEAMQAGQL